MITEKEFSEGYASYWHELLPMSESFVRLQQVHTRRFLPMMKSHVDAERRGLVNEVAARLLAAQLRIHALHPREIPEDIVEQAITSGLNHVSHMRAYARQPLVRPDGDALDEAFVLAERTRAFLANRQLHDIVVEPPFAGCGWLDSCCGDFIVGDTLIEVKSGQRAFRSIDLRQVLCYCALNFAAKHYEIANLCLVNPRLGTFMELPVEVVCREAAAKSSVEVLGDIVDYISEPAVRY